ncbi:MAG: hypothetical protein JNL65_12675 [Saprospiraceae bacterium]|nr:hypothetical protein [Saprospiraceae bacterium]
MKFDVEDLGWLLLTIWIIQTIFYLGYLVFHDTFNFEFRKILYISVATSLILSLIIQFGGFYKSIQAATCGTEKFNPIGIIGVYGSIGSLIIYIIFSILKKVIDKLT